MLKQIVAKEWDVQRKDSNSWVCKHAPPVTQTALTSWHCSEQHYSQGQTEKHLNWALSPFILPCSWAQPTQMRSTIILCQWLPLSIWKERFLNRKRKLRLSPGCKQWLWACFWALSSTVEKSVFHSWILSTGTFHQYHLEVSPQGYSLILFLLRLTMP